MCIYCDGQRYRGREDNNMPRLIYAHQKGNVCVCKNESTNSYPTICAEILFMYYAVYKGDLKKNLKNNVCE